MRPGIYCITLRDTIQLFNLSAHLVQYSAREGFCCSHLDRLTLLFLQKQLHLLRRRYRGQLPPGRYCRSPAPLPHRHRHLLHPQRETMCQMQPDRGINFTVLNLRSLFIQSTGSLSNFNLKEVVKNYPLPVVTYLLRKF